MSDEIKVSIYCLAYNHGPYIRKTLDGFVSQKTDFPFEVIVHDDASTDNTADIIREYAAKYDFIRPILQTENQYTKNPHVGRAFIYPLVRGKYIAYCEGDDYWTDETKLQKQVDYLDAHPDCTMCCHAYNKIRAHDEEVLETICTLDEEGDISPAAAISYNGRPTQLATQVLRADVVLEMPALYYSCDVGDYPLLLRAIACGKVHYLEDNMAAYRVSTTGSWTQRIYRDRQRQLNHWIKIKAFLELYDAHCEGRFHTEVAAKLDEIDFRCALLTYDYQRAAACRTYHEKSTARKAIIRLGCVFPGLAKMIDKLKRGR